MWEKIHRLYRYYFDLLFFSARKFNIRSLLESINALNNSGDFLLLRLHTHSIYTLSFNSLTRLLACLLALVLVFISENANWYFMVIYEMIFLLLRFSFKFILLSIIILLLCVQREGERRKGRMNEWMNDSECSFSKLELSSNSRNLSKSLKTKAASAAE